MSTEYTAQLHLVALQRRLGMADLTNFTQDNSQKTFSELLCKAEFTGKVHNELIFLSVLNTFLSITAFLENTSCPAQGHFASSAVQTPFSKPCDN